MFCNLKETEATFNPGKQYSITLICHDKNNRRLRYGVQDIKPSFTGMEVSDVSVTDKKDSSYTISFCPRQGGMLKFEVSINGTPPAPNCSLTKQVKWVISDAHGKGPITDDGCTMRGDGGYCCRVGGCYFDSGVHTWKVRLRNLLFGDPTAEVGIIDCDGINAYMAQSKKKCVHKHSVRTGPGDDISFNLDMEKRTLNVKVINSSLHCSSTNSYQFTARRASPFFACNSSFLSISLVE